MEQELISDKQPPAKKIYKDKQVWVGAFIGGPLTAGYLIAENFKVFGEKSKVLNTWMIAFGATLFLLFVSLFAPYIDRVPNGIITLLYTGIAFLLMRIFQGEKVNGHIQTGGQIQSWWKAIGISLIGLSITIILFVGVAFSVDTVKNANLTTKNYGASKHNITFDKDNISESEIDALAKTFTETTLFDNGDPWYIYIQKVENNYEITISVQKIVLNQPQNLAFFEQNRKETQALFPNNKIIYKLAADDFDNIIKRIE